MSTTRPVNRAPPNVGDKAPALELVTGKGKDGKATRFRLEDAIKEGPVIVAFFPGAFTSTCTDEMACFTRDWNKYASLGAQFIGVSVDSAPSLRAFAATHSYKVPLGSDFDKTAMHAWGVADQFWWGEVTKRATFVVDRNGIVRYAEVQSNADLEPSYDAIQAALKGIR